MINQVQTTDAAETDDLISLAITATEKLFVVYSADGRIAHFAPACAKMAGMPAETARGQTTKSLFGSFGQNEIMWQSFGPLNPKDFPKISTECWTFGNQDPVWLNWTNTAVVNESGVVDFVVAEGALLDENGNGEPPAADEITISVEQTIVALTLTIQQRDPESAAHQVRVAKFAEAIAATQDLSDAEGQNVFFAALIHDIGQVFVPQNILYQTGGLSGAEYSTVQQHCQIGANIMRSAQAPDGLSDVILHHHERFDGSGYPDGLAGDQIALGARIVAVADAAEAMLSARPYRPPLSLEQVLDELQSDRGNRFDPAIADAAIALLRDSAFRFA